MNAETVNKSICFTGDGYVSPGSFSTESNIVTVEFWAFKESWHVSAPEVLLSNFENGGWQFSIDNVSIYLKAYLDGTEKITSFPVSGMTNGWHHFALTFDGNYLRFYLDGYQRGFVFDFKSVLTKPAAGTWLTLGCESMVNGGSTPYFTGKIDEVRMWSKSLSSSDIRDWMHREITEIMKPDYIQNLVLYYRFNEPEIYRDNNQTLNSVSGYDLISYQNSISEISTVPVIDADQELLNTRALWSAFSQGTYSEPSGGLNLGINDYNEFEVHEADLFGHNGQTGIITDETNDGVDLQAKRVWKIIAGHDDEFPSLRFQIFDAGAGALFYDCIPVYNYKLMYKAFEEDTFRIIDEADNIEGNLVFFKDVDVKSGYYTIARDNDMPTVTSATEVLNITTTTAEFGGTVGCDGGAEVTAYGVCWNTTGSATLNDFYTVDGSGTGDFASLLDSLEPGILYYVRAYATNSEGTAYGEEMAFQTNKMYQSVVFPEIPEKKYGAPDFNPGAFSSSGLPVIYTSSNSDVAIITDENNIHITGVGTSTIWVYQPGNINYSPSSYKKMTLTVNKAVLRVSADDKTIIYGDSLPMLTYTINGFVNNEDTSVLISLPYIDTEAVDSDNTGDYIITVSGGEAENYIFEYISGRLTIERAELIVSAMDQHIIYGDSLPEPNYIITGFVKGEDTTVLSEMPGIICQDTSVIPDAGIYEIVVSGGEALNYTLHYQNSTLSVDKALLTIEVENKIVVYGDSIPELTYTISGFIPKDTAYEPEALPEISTNAGMFSYAGSYIITVAGAYAKNYEFNYIDGILTITKAVLKVTAKDTAIVYGSDLPEFNYLISGKKEGDPNLVFEEAPQLTTDAEKLSNVGIYTIFADGGVSQNYSPEYINGELSIIKATPEVTELPETTPLIEGDPLLNAQIQGGVISTNGWYEFLDPEYVPDSTGEEVDVIFMPEDTLNYSMINMKVGVIISTNTSVILPKSEVMVLYPNPVLSSFILKGLEYGSVVRIFDLSGSLKKIFYWSGNAIDVSDFDQGMYVVSSGNQMIKFVRQ